MKSNKKLSHYNFTNCKPIGEYSNKDIKELQSIFNKKLKKVGYNNVEFRMRFSKRLRWDYYKTKETFFMVQNETSNYLEVIEIFSNNAMMNEKYRNVLQSYVNTGSIPISCKLVGFLGSPKSVYEYLYKNFSKMLTYVNEEWPNERNR